MLDNFDFLFANRPPKFHTILLHFTILPAIRKVCAITNLNSDSKLVVYLQARKLKFKLAFLNVNLDFCYYYYFLLEDVPLEFRISTTVLMDHVQVCSGMPKVCRISNMSYFRNSRLDFWYLFYANRLHQDCTLVRCSQACTLNNALK